MSDIQRHHPSSAALCRYIRELTGPTALLSFSTGKDAIVAWHQLREHFTRIVPFYLYLVPGLSFVEDSLAYYEDHFGTPILRLPHPALFDWMRKMTAQPPEHCAAIEQVDLPRVGYGDVEDEVRRLSGAPEAWVANGTRTADSPNRYASVKRYGSCNPARRNFFAVYDWKMADVLASLQAHGTWLPVDYHMFGRSFDGLDHRFLEPIRQYYPADYRRILEWFPLAGTDTFRRRVA